MRMTRLSICLLVSLLAATLWSERANAVRWTPQPAQASSSSFAALGASETFGVGATPRTQGFAYIVGRKLHAARVAVLGISGATIRQAYAPELRRALSLRPSLSTLFFGFNDIAQGVTLPSFLRDLSRMVHALRSTGTQVLVIGLPDVSILPAVRASGITNVRPILDRWNAGMQATAAHNGAGFLNLATSRYSTELASHPEYVSGDGLHPSNIGHARLAQIVVARIRALHLWH